MSGKSKAAKRKSLPKDFEQMLDTADLAGLQAVFETCDIEARGGYAKETALLMADRRDDLVRWLVAQGANLAAVDAYGNTALHLRARSRRSDIGVLIELGCDVNAKKASGETPLHAAADTKNVKAVEQLLAAGAEVDAQAHYGLTPLEVALSGCSNVQIVDMVPVARFLLAAGARRGPLLQGFVKRVGETFEFHRSGFNPDSVEAASGALEELCQIFEVVPPPRRRLHDGTAAIEVHSQTWPEQHKELWNLLVPSKGPAVTSQGEAIRISGRIAHEIDGNGGCNWDRDFGAMARTLLRIVGSGSALPADQLIEVEGIVATLLKTQSGDTRRLAELSVAWVLVNPIPISFGKPEYSR